MTCSEILKQLERAPEPPDEVLEAAAEQWEALVPKLIAVLEEVIADPERVLADEDYTLHLYAIALLAQFEETRAADCFVRLFSLPGDLASELTGNLLVIDGPEVLASVCGGSSVPLLRLALDESLDGLVRDRAIEALAIQVVWKQRDRLDAVQDLRTLFHGGLARPGDDFVWSALVSAVCNLGANELLPEVREAIADGLVDEDLHTLEEVEELLAPQERSFAEFYATFHDPIVDAGQAVLDWLKEDEAEDDEDDEDDEDEENEDEELPEKTSSADLHPFIASSEPYIAPKKVGRNDPCPCGSGKKFKKCCGKE